jgi:Lrp/AsnC family leucine-responsive transcriptional regulator
MTELDRTDRRLLRLLQKDGRFTNAELAKQANLSAATCHRRTQRLFAEGFIRGVRAEIAPERVELGTLVMVGVVLDRSTPESFGAFEEAAAKLTFILDCLLVAGDIADFRRLHGEQLIALPGVRQTRTFFVMKEVISDAPLAF